MMDVSTSLVQAYLHVNGYFTATDYPLVESKRDQAPRTLTDIDMLAVRLHRYPDELGQSRKDSGKVHGPMTMQTDPVLECPPDRTDMIVAEVKQGRAQVNPGSRNRDVLAAALVRFGCCSSEEAPGLTQALLQHGRAQGKSEHIVRMVLFASSGARAPRGWHWVHLDHVFQFLDTYLRSEQSVLGHVDLHDPALAWLSLMHKSNLSLRAGSPHS
ncbi:MAG TPA: hypothetical protein PKH39_09785 [Woeseiaceae bacterium]|nr:hypothetical protein [Woeseiaceae bacterium]